MKPWITISAGFLLLGCGNSETAPTESVQNPVTFIEKPVSANSKGRIVNSPSGCLFNAANQSQEIEIYFPRLTDQKAIENIVSFSGLPMNFEVYGGNINNALATIIDNKRYIVCDPALMAHINQTTNNYWSSISILAHEIGHHLAGHTLEFSGDSHKAELEADKYSGFLMYKMGATKEEAIKAMQLMGSSNDTPTHPNKQKRIEAILEGWMEANRQRYLAAIPPPPSDDPNDFYEFTKEMLVPAEYLNDESASLWYGKYEFCYGIVTEVESDHNVDEFQIYVTKTSPDLFRNINGEVWRVYVDMGEDMCNMCRGNLRALLVPGRRLKFAMVEGFPGMGTIHNGIWYLTYAKALDGNAF